MNQMLKALHHERLERRSSGVCKVFQLGPSGHSKTVLQVKIFERGGAAIGSIVWPGAKFLCAFLLDNVDLLVKGKSAVELGAGCGLLGISYSMLGGDVVITEQDTGGLLELIDKSVEANKENITSAGGSAVSHCYSWGEKFDSTVLEFPDFIIGSDILYSKECVEPLFVSICRELIPTSNRKTALILSYRPRDTAAEKNFFDRLESDGFFINLVKGTVVEKSDAIFVISRQENNNRMTQYLK